MMVSLYGRKKIKGKANHSTLPLHFHKQSVIIGGYLNINYIEVSILYC